MKNKDSLLKNKNNIFKLAAGLTTCGMIFYAGRAGITQIKLNKIQNQKKDILSSYEEKAPNETMEYFRNFATKEDLEAYEILNNKEKASKTALEGDLSTAGAMFIAFSLTGYGALLNNEINKEDKNLSEIGNSKEDDHEM